MDTQTLLLLVVAGVAGGMMTALVGGAAVVTFPALIAPASRHHAQHHTPSLQAVTCNLTAAVPGGFWPRFRLALLVLALHRRDLLGQFHDALGHSRYLRP